MADQTASGFTELLARWESDEGKPYKGSLIDWNQYGGNGDEPPADLGCMCAQGQALHVLGGWTPRQIREIGSQAKADLATAELLNISISHAILLRSINDQAEGAPAIVLTHPERVLGEGAAGILAFWLHLDRMTAEDWGDAWAARDARDAWAARAARDAWAAWDAWDARDAVYAALAEIGGARWLPEHEEGKFVFLPMFGFADPAALPPLPADYGQPKGEAA